MNWSIGDARSHFSEMLEAARREPQFIARRGHPVAVIVAAEVYEAFESWQRSRPSRSLGESLDELHRACAESDYEFELPTRSDRPNPFAAGR